VIARLRRAAQRRPLVLLYHRVATLDDDRWHLAVSPKHFDQQMLVLRTCFRPTPLHAVLDQRGAVAVTFDDGYSDNATSAAPILAKHRIPATFFITTEPVTTGREFWWDELAALADANDYSAKWQTMKRMNGGDRERALDELARARNLGRRTRGSHRPMTVDELRRLALMPQVEIGAHTRTHACLAALDADDERREIAGGRHELQELTQREVASFAYPFGGPEDYSERTVGVVRKAGFRFAFRSGAGVVRRDVDPMRIPRCYVRDWNGAAFAMQLLRWLTAADAGA